MEVVFFNGAFVDKKSVSISYNSRAFNYGDGFFETVKIINSKPFNFSYHFNRITNACIILELANNYTKAFFYEKISYILEINKIINGSIKIHISRSGSGKYLPDSCESDMFISSSYGISYKNNNSISLCFYDNELKSAGALSNIKSSNALIYILAAIYSNKNNCDNAILFNNSRKVIEASNANIFIVKEKIIYTPPLSDGCVDGTMRRWVNDQLDIIQKSILLDDINDADEVFITNSISGIISVKTIELISFNKFNIADHLQKKLISLGSGL